MNIIEEFIGNYLRNEGGNFNLLGKFSLIILIFLGAFLTSKILTYIIKKNLYSNFLKKQSSYNRILTIVNLATKVIRILIAFIAVTLALDVIGLNTNSLLATVGVGSLALSFGAQSLVKDVINGFFIILEDQYRVGDLVEIENRNGYIEEVGIRCTKIRDFGGEVHIIPNGKIGIVTNKQRGNMRSKVVVSVDSTENPEKVLELLDKRLSVMRKNKSVVKGPNIWGVTNNTEKGYEITIVAYAKPGEQYEIEYEIRKNVVQLFIENNIKQPNTNYRTEVKENASLSSGGHNNT